MQKYVFSKLDLKVKRQYFRYKEYINWLLIDEILTYVFMYGGLSTSFLRYEPLKKRCDYFWPIFWPENAFSPFSYTGGLLVCKNEKLNCFDIQCVAEASRFSLNHNMTLESKENYSRHTKTVQNSLGFMPEVKPLHKPRGDLVLCTLNDCVSLIFISSVFGCQSFIRVCQPPLLEVNTPLKMAIMDSFDANKSIPKSKRTFIK